MKTYKMREEKKNEKNAMKTNDKSKVTKAFFPLLASSFHQIEPATIWKNERENKAHREKTNTFAQFFFSFELFRVTAAFQLLWSLFIEIVTC